MKNKTIDLLIGIALLAMLPGIASAWEFNTPNDKEGWFVHNIISWSVEVDGMFRIDPNINDPYIESPSISVSANSFNTIDIRMSSNAPDQNGAIYFKTSTSPEFSEDKKVEFSVITGPSWYDYSVLMTQNPRWTGTITGIRVDPSNTGRADNSDAIGFDYIRLKFTVPTVSDTEKPKVNSMSAAPSSLSLGKQVTVSYSVQDNIALKQVELWYKEPGGDWNSVETKSISGTSSSGSFSPHIPSKAGTNSYGIHVVDTAGNWDSEGSAGPKTVEVTAPTQLDTEKPKVISMSAPSSATLGNQVTVSYSVQDNKALRQVELWYMPPGGSWNAVETKLISGTSVSGSFTHTPSNAGKNSYGIHVVDTAWNWDSEGTAGPKIVEVTATTQLDTEKPKVISMSAPSSAILGNQVTVSYSVQDNTALRQVELWYMPPGGSWNAVETRLISGKVATGSFSPHTPSKAGTNSYGIHVVDTAWNWDSEGGAGPKTVEVTSSTKLVLSDNGLKFIAAPNHEGFSSKLYNDGGGKKGHCTIGYGHLVHLGPCDGSEPAEFKNGITKEKGLLLLKSDAQIAVNAVNRLVTVALNQNQFDAMVSFTFNLGAGGFSKSTVLRELNAGRYENVPSELNKYVYSNGKKLPGLITRRKDEGALFMMPP